MANQPLEPTLDNMSQLGVRAAPPFEQITEHDKFTSMVRRQASNNPGTFADWLAH
jgi:hypothetical protein